MRAENHAGLQEELPRNRYLLLDRGKWRAAICPPKEKPERLVQTVMLSVGLEYGRESAVFAAKGFEAAMILGDAPESVLGEGLPRSEASRDGGCLPAVPGRACRRVPARPKGFRAQGTSAEAEPGAHQRN